MNPKEFRRHLRHFQTPAEKSLWYALRGKRFQLYKFRRQHTLGAYTVDFFNVKHRLIIEVDGSIHADPSQHQYDQERDQYLKESGYHTLRFRNEEILGGLEGVLASIETYLKEN